MALQNMFLLALVWHRHYVRLVLIQETIIISSQWGSPVSADFC